MIKAWRTIRAAWKEMRFSKKVVTICVSYLGTIFTVSYVAYYAFGTPPPMELLALISGVFGGELLLTCVSSALGDKNDNNKEET